MVNPYNNKPKIFCLGLSRTGTTSLARGLEMLGLQVAHFPLSLLVKGSFTPRLNHGLWSRWQLHRQVKAARFHNAERMLLENDVFADLPIPIIYEELDQQFPASKFIVTSRETEGWLSSMEWLFRDRPDDWSQGPLIDELHFAAYGCTRFDRQALTKAWEKHEAKLDNYFSGRSSDLLRINIDQGDLNYPTICSFLECEIPNFPFPQVNQRTRPEASNDY